MSNQPPGLWAQIFARDPRTLVRFPDLPIDAALAELAEISGMPATPQAPAAAPAGAENEQLPQALSSLATHLWRAKGKLVDPATGEPREESRRIYRHVEAALETFSQLGVTMNDWLNQPYDPGLPVKVLTFQPTPELTRDTVVEATRPTVMWNDRLLQLAEVIVGIPPEKAS
ncbi:MAG TPA: hypothetical protein VIM69_03515 [Opitutaceae bacterium]